MNINIISYNVNGLNKPIKRSKVLSQMKHEGGDIVFMQETNMSKMEHEKLAKLFDAQVFYSSHHSSRRGVITLIRNHIPYEVEDVVCDKDGRQVLTEGKTDADYITLLNIYNRPDEGPSTIEKIIHLVTVQSKGVIVLGGDFNLLMNEKWILKVAQSTLNPTQKDYTYYSPGNYSRLDYFFVFFPVPQVQYPASTWCATSSSLFV
uniref:exodeoxyribonuclease III n=1 Tax=Seriola dumerili TaxID=41447 RepID=A0A3B4U7Q8_SERDU